MSEPRRPDTIKGYNHLTNTNYSKTTRYKTFTEGIKVKNMNKSKSVESGNSIQHTEKILALIKYVLNVIQLLFILVLVRIMTKNAIMVIFGTLLVTERYVKEIHTSNFITKVIKFIIM